MILVIFNLAEYLCLRTEKIVPLRKAKEAQAAVNTEKDKER